MKNILFFGLVFLVLCRCEKSEVIELDYSGLIIKAGYICGWGAGIDSIILTKTAIKYVYYVPMKSRQPQMSKIRRTTDEEWSEIFEDVDMDNFIKINYNTCNVCVDGCDEWISVKNENNSHRISFNIGESINSIRNLQMKLIQLRNEFNPNPDKK